MSSAAGVILANLVTEVSSLERNLEFMLLLGTYCLFVEWSTIWSRIFMYAFDVRECLVEIVIW